MAATKEALEQEGLKYTVPASFQVIFILGTCIALFFILYAPVVSFKTSDVYPELVSITPQKIMQFGGTPAPVHVGMYIRDFTEFNMVKGKFVIDVTVWLRFNPRLISLDRIGKFTFEMAKIEYKSEPTTRIVGRDLIARYDMRLKVHQHLNYSDFPLDDHRLNFTLVHNDLSPSDIAFKSSRSNLTVSSEVKLAGWDFVDKRVKTGYIEDRLDQYDKSEAVYNPRVVFSLDYERAGVRHIISIFVPILLIFFLSLLTFSFNPFGRSAGSIMGISASSITAMIAYRFVIENMSPSTGEFMLSDNMFLLFLICSCVVFFTNIMSRKFTREFKCVVIVLLHATVLIALFYLVANLR